ncbi:hypothetical protein ACFZC5_35735, partial [Nocardia gamkensis]
GDHPTSSKPATITPFQPKAGNPPSNNAGEPHTESILHDDSYGYQPMRGALDAVVKCRERCWQRGWVIDLDVEKFFDWADHDLMVKAVQANVNEQKR